MGTGQSTPAPSPDDPNHTESGTPRTLTDRIRELLPTGGELERKKQVVPTQFKWPYGGRQVYIAGSFNDWKGKVPMRVDPDAEAEGTMATEGGEATPIFTITLDLLPGTHYYKFIVDDQWQYDPGKDRMINHQGVVNNVIEVKASRPERLPALSPLDGVMGDPESYGQETPKEFTADPPPLPPQLTHLAHLNQTSIVKPTPPVNPGTDGGSTNMNTEGEEQVVPNPLIPLHVTLNHVCFRKPEKQSAISSDNRLVVIGVTQRYRARGLPHAKERFVTTMYYKPVDETGAGPMQTVSTKTL
uniref:Association with the SNF1 complex (ASC) domain-containing protein n=1 Tax=Norrisiella sphaerica TaxID=552664 RepID=A0A7S2QT02_9EUKA|mmetsp:Transcript_2361/g.3400  ORF Transcript_2361/g.3400 Transcript_2361/m.3400 type:complete len:300 (+) Transcript_2361:144-1043(+)|eukprot:CAMPEP_0184481590 /NCGR_PEP_ID=MMETSP0113_2-20130426/3146_1 /TAXON_ID=91329 /ORGANISM="Norrisiella sphaerica, Strain BC52" /LENGTH=299 /DNA_ID=CAMNT_0026860805 /DNA_START=131 /DNA_END=1030 /DNA_ORIENTATION=-